MFIEYKVYRKMSDWKPFISRDELPSCQMMGKKKFVGKKAKIDPWKNRDIFCEKVERRKQDAENS